MKSKEYILTANKKILESYFEGFDCWYEIDPISKRSVRIFQLPNNYLN